MQQRHSSKEAKQCLATAQMRHTSDTGQCLFRSECRSSSSCAQMVTQRSAP